MKLNRMIKWIRDETNGFSRQSEKGRYWHAWERRGKRKGVNDERGKYESMLDWIPSVVLIRLITWHQRSVRAWPASAERSLGTITLTTGFCLQTCTSTTRLGPFVIPFELRLARHHRSKKINCTFPRLGEDQQLFCLFAIIRNLARYLFQFWWDITYNIIVAKNICSYEKSWKLK